MNAMIVCHAGIGIGLGHLSRCFVIARSLKKELGVNAHILIQGDAIHHSDLNAYDHDYLIAEESLTEAVMQQMKQKDFRVVVFDLQSKLVPNDFAWLLGLLKQRQCKVIGVDGLEQFHISLDMLFFPSIQYTPPQDITFNIPVLWGWDCFLLNVQESPAKWQVGLKVLILTGGSDATGLSKSLPVLLADTLSCNTEIHWVTGPFSEAPLWPETMRQSVVNHQSPSGLGHLMKNANYAITVFGVSFFELLYFGVPTVVFSPYGSKDDAALKALEQESVALVAKDEKGAVLKLNTLMKSLDMAVNCSSRAKRRMSAFGGKKFAQAVTKLFN
jgi:spore coat polysaccharide biosynthesis predicted glycosyltransferase SpsG